MRHSGAAERLSGIELHGHAAGVIDAGEQKACFRRVDVFIHGAAGALPVAVVIDDEDSTDGEPRVEMLELVARRFVPVGIEPENRDLHGRVIGNRLLHTARNKVDEVFGIAGREDVGSHIVERGIAPGAARLAILGGQQLRGIGAVKVTIRFGRRGHSFKRVKKMEPPAIATLTERERRGHHAAASPHTALDDVACDPVLRDMPHGIAEREDALGACHREWPHRLDDAAGFIVEIRWKRSWLVPASRSEERGHPHGWLSSEEGASRMLAQSIRAPTETLPRWRPLAASPATTTLGRT